eukprot:3596979-Pyramimonas_sp.AAC.1
MACQSSGCNLIAGWPAALVASFWVAFPMRTWPFQREMSILDGWMKSRSWWAVHDAEHDAASLAAQHKLRMDAQLAWESTSVAEPVDLVHRPLEDLVGKPPPREDVLVDVAP